MKTAVLLRDILRHVCEGSHRKELSGLTDGQLLERFLRERDGAAFEWLVRRHGPLVMGVCRRILRNEADAEDAFQATFLILVRKAASVLPAEVVGNWLYGVAYNTARKAKAMNSKRRAKEREAGSRLRPETHWEDWEQLEALLDQEVSRLPDKYRVPIVLCDLEGKSYKEAAHELGCPLGTLSGRLTRARGLLAKRLARHGVSLSVGSLVGASSQAAAPAGIAVPLVASTVKAAVSFAAGETAGAASIKVAALTEGVLKAMFLNNLKNVTVAILLLVACGMSLGIGLGMQPTPDDKQTQTKPATESAREPRADEGNKEGKSNEAVVAEYLRTTPWVLTRLDSANGTISVTHQPNSRGLNPKVVDGRLKLPIGGLSMEGLAVAKDAKIQLDGKERKFADLEAGMQVSIRTGKDGLTIIGIDAASRKPDANYILTDVDAAKDTISITAGENGKLERLPVARDARISAEWLNVKLQAMESQRRKISDLRVGMRVQLELAQDGRKIVVKGIHFSE